MIIILVSLLSYVRRVRQADHRSNRIGYRLARELVPVGVSILHPTGRTNRCSVRDARLAFGAEFHINSSA